MGYELSGVWPDKKTDVESTEPGMVCQPAIFETYPASVNASKVVESEGERTSGVRINVVVIDHNMRFIAGLCDRVVVVHQGKELVQDTPEAVLANPRVVAAYLGASGGRRCRGDQPC